MLKIKKITIAGFRGFNCEQSIDINKNLTIVYGPNSYGKTSISEALEWLLFGVTSKVQEHVSGKNEFKGTYKNIHYKEESKPFVELILLENSEEIIIRGELQDDDTIDRFFNNEKVNEWPWYSPGLEIHSPFILQHALQDFLLSSPSTRYSKISRIMGTEILEDLQIKFNSLATSFRPPIEIQRFIAKMESFLKYFSDDIFKKFLKSINNYDLTNTNTEINYLVSIFTQNEELSVINEDKEINSEVLEILRSKRKQEVSSIFDKDIVLLEISDQEREYQSLITAKISIFESKEISEKYLNFTKLIERQELDRLANFLQNGFDISQSRPEECPFCGSPFSSDNREIIKKRHEKILLQISEYDSLNTEKNDFLGRISYLRNDINNFYSSLKKKITAITDLDNETDKAKLQGIFGDEDRSVYTKLFEIINILKENLFLLTESKMKSDASLENIANSFSEFNQSTIHITNLIQSIYDFLTITKGITDLIASKKNLISEISEELQARLNFLAGTQRLASVISILENYYDIRKFILINKSIDSMKSLRSCVTEFVTQKTKALIEDQLTDEVMNWYNQIKTDGDPNVHFSGFSLGGTKSRHEIIITASSYGEDLVSAVSSLSESKLNALGLSMKIANNLKENNPFGFLIVDDPVQSLDEHHEVQIVTIVRRLVEEYNRQIILLSHNKKWLEQLKKGCESINGLYYEISGFDITGPRLQPTIWKTWDRRLREVNSICNNNNSSSINLQNAEAEIRLAVCEITALLYKKEKGINKSPHNFNSTKVRELLIECNVPSKLIDQIGQTFTTTDLSHHPCEDYVANVQRIKQYHGWVHDLANLLKEK